MDRVRDHLEASARELDVDGSKALIRPAVTARLVRDVSMEVSFTQFGRDYRLSGVIATGPDAEAPSPLRYFLTSLALCVEGWWAKASAVIGCELESVELEAKLGIDVRGEHGFDDVPRHPQWVEFVGRISSPASPEQVLAVVDLGDDRCPLLSLVRLAVPVYELVIHNGVAIRDTTPREPAALQPMP
jgi:uncharacterized OsmC-like protein